jgi:hypothetical protein
VMVLGNIYPPYMKGKGEWPEIPKGKRSWPKLTVSKYEVFLLFSVLGLQFVIFLYMFLISLYLFELTTSFSTPVRAGGTAACTRTGGPYFLWKLFLRFPSDFIFE